MNYQEPERLPIPKSIRFEVFKRDKFTCQYCGAKAPDIILHIDHITPVSKGGTNDLLNLITACVECNLGKSNRTLVDTTIISRKRVQIEELQERREQIEMMMEWQRGLVELDRYLVAQVAEFWAELVEPYCLTEQGLKSLKKLLQQNSLDEVMEAMQITTKQYLQYENDQPTQESVIHAWSKIGGICKIKKVEKSKPYIRDIFYVRGILRKRLNYVNEWLCLKLLEEAYQYGADIEKLKEHACSVRNWTQWRRDIETFIESVEETKIDLDEFDIEESFNSSQEEDKETNAGETDTEVINQFLETFNSYAKEMNYNKIAEMCNQFLDPQNLNAINFISSINHWFITINDKHFIVDLVKPQESFKARYKHWFLDYERSCIYTLDGGYEYDIGFETIYSDERKQEWIRHLNSKTWSSPEMIAELIEILQSSFYISLQS